MANRKSTYGVVSEYFGTIALGLAIFIVIALFLESKRIDFLEAAGIVVGTAALVFAVVAAVDLKTITNSLSTRYVDSFPEHLTYISKLVDDAEDSIIVFLDCVDYGSVYPELHKDLLSALQRALTRSRKFRITQPFRSLKERKKIDVQFLVLGTPQPISIGNKLHLLEEDSLKIMEPGKIIKRYFNALKRYRPDFIAEHNAVCELFRPFVEDAKTDWRKQKTVLYRFLDTFQDWEMTILEQLGAHIDGTAVQKWRTAHKEGAKDLRTAIKLPRTLAGRPHADLFFWMRDRREAVLLFPHRGDDALAFATRDIALIKHLYFVFEEEYYKATGKYYSDRWK